MPLGRPEKVFVNEGSVRLTNVAGSTEMVNNLFDVIAKLRRTAKDVLVEAWTESRRNNPKSVELPPEKSL